jgi:type IV pilus assembly protein PilA
MTIHTHIKFAHILIVILALIFTLIINTPAQASDGVALSENIRGEIKKQLEAGCRLGITEPFITGIFEKEKANGLKNITEADFREKMLGSQEWKDSISPLIQSMCNCAFAKPLADLAAVKTDDELIQFVRSMADYMEQVKANPAIMEKCTKSLLTQNPVFQRRSKFAEVVRATNDAKIGVEICGYDRSSNLVGVWQIAGCGGGSAGVPADINNPTTSVVTSVKTADNGVITATAGTLDGLDGETFILTPTFKGGRTFWQVSGTCLTTTPPLCRASLGMNEKDAQNEGASQ